MPREMEYRQYLLHDWRRLTENTPYWKSRKNILIPIISFNTRCLWLLIITRIENLFGPVRRVVNLERKVIGSIRTRGK